MEHYGDGSRRRAYRMFLNDVMKGSSSASRMMSNFNNAGRFAVSNTTMLATPPPEIEECNPLLYPYSFPYQSSLFAGSPQLSQSDYFMRGSSLEESPLSSPSSEVGGQQFGSALGGTIGCKRSGSPMAKFKLRSVLQDSNPFVSSYHGELEEPPIPDGIKMPQRKGGIQLWQFLYALLTDPDHMHPELIEWTCNRGENEFRLLEPEAIAVWWGYHKNKVNMNYEKFSRSLRYYYDKGILKKIPGERYVYCFCIDPERMYKHIGISDCRPQIKPMPKDVERTISKFQGKQNINLSSRGLITAAPAPEPLRPMCRSHSDTFPSHLQFLNHSRIGHYQFGPSRPIERSHSFDIDDAVYPTNPTEELPRTASLPNMYSFESSAATQETRNSPAGSPVHSVCDRFSTSMSGDFAITAYLGHDFDAEYNYNSHTTMSENFNDPSTSASFADDSHFFADQLLTWD